MCIYFFFYLRASLKLQTELKHVNMSMLERNKTDLVMNVLHQAELLL